MSRQYESEKNRIESAARRHQLSPHPSRIIDIEKAQEYRKVKRREATKSAKRKARQERAAEGGRRGSFITGKRLVYLAILAFVLTISTVSGAKVISLQAEAREARGALDAKEAEKARLNKELDMADDPGYIEDQARDKLRMIMKGETLYVFSTQEEDNSQ